MVLNQPVGEFDPAKLGELDEAIVQAIAEKELPGAVIWIEHGSSTYWKAYGRRALVPQEETMTRDTIFDVASLTKVLSCAPAIMLLIERGQITLDTPIYTFFPQLCQNDKKQITVRHLLTHTSGMPGELSIHPKWQGTEAALRLVFSAKLRSSPGRDFNYGDINFLLLGELVHRISELPLNEFCMKEIYQPLGMVDTGFLPLASLQHRIAPTEMVGNIMLRGVAHDPTARYMGGVSGHAGVFTTAQDLSRFARMMLNLGELEGVRIFKEDTVKLMTSVQTPPHVCDRRGFGWDIDSPYSAPRGFRFPLGSYGHTGFTGAALWIDPYSRTFSILLSNRIHPHAKQNLVKLYRKVGTLAAEAVTDFDFDHVRDALPPFSHGLG